MMTLEEMKTLLQSTNLPVAYLAFPASNAPDMPFLIYQETGSHNFGADNTVWHSAMRIQVDLFTHRKDRSTEEILEAVLTEADIYWERVVEFDDDEDCYRATYEVEI